MEPHATARAGDTEADLATRLKQTMLTQSAHGFAFEPIVLSGPKAADPHGTPGERAERAQQVDPHRP
jgi:Xaa-Pro aminopeptidase